MGDLYQALGVSQNATQDEIKKAYRDAAFKYHPDRNPGNTAAEDTFKNISAAYTILGDEAKRADYDRFGEASYAQQPTGSYQTYEDIFEQMFRQQQDQERTGKSYSYTYYGPFSAGKNRKPNVTRRDAWAMLFRGVITAGLGIFIFRFAWLFGMLGVILCLSAIVSGISTTINALRFLFTSEGQNQ